jgi:hypothetical protein
MSLFIGMGASPKGYKGDYIRLTWLKERVETPPEGIIEIVLHYYAKAYIMHMFGVMIFTDLIDNAIPCYILPLLENFVVILNYSWGLMMITYLCCQLCHEHMSDGKQIVECLLFQQV